MREAPLPELHWNIDLQQPPGPGHKPDSAGAALAKALTHQFALPRGAAAKLRASQLHTPSGLPAAAPSRPAPGRPAAKEDRPATALAPLPAGPLQGAPSLQRSASCDLAWRLPKGLHQPAPKAGAASPLGTGDDRGRAAQPKEGGAVMPQAKRSSVGPGGAAAKVSALAKADSLKQPPQPAPATPAPDVASLRRWDPAVPAWPGLPRRCRAQCPAVVVQGKAHGAQGAQLRGQGTACGSRPHEAPAGPRAGFPSPLTRQQWQRRACARPSTQDGSQDTCQARLQLPAPLWTEAPSKSSAGGGGTASSRAQLAQDQLQLVRPVQDGGRRPARRRGRHGQVPGLRAHLRPRPL